MAFCSDCGKKLPQGATFCTKCGTKVKKEESVSEPEEEPKPIASETKQAEKPVAEPAPKPGGGSKAGWACGICGILFAIGVILFAIFCFFILAFIGAKGQPGTIIPPTEIKTPQNLTANPTDSAIDLSWKQSTSQNIDKYNVYKSDKNGKDYKKISTQDANNLQYKDTQITKGITYYYVTTAVAKDGKESGNSNQASSSVTPPPLIPQGITSWKDVLNKYNADSKYAGVLTIVTKLTKADIEKYVSLESKGKNLKTTLKKGTIITNTTENYKIIPYYVLTQNKEFLTDDKGVPHIMVWCGNPIKLIKKVTWISEVVQVIQSITYNIIYVFPTSVTNIFINASQPINTVIVNVLPNTFGPTVMNPETVMPASDWPQGQVMVDTIQDLFGTENQPLQAGQQWAVEGKILLEANPHDPAPGESVKMKIKLSSGQSGVAIKYSVSGTDGYSASGDLTTDTNGETSFNIPGGADNIVDTIKVTVPDQNLEGETSYTF